LSLPPRMARMRFNTFSFLPGVFRPSHSSKIGATVSGRRRISRQAHPAPAALAAGMHSKKSSGASQAQTEAQSRRDSPILTHPSIYGK
jgi:hypothetical protein